MGDRLSKELLDIEKALGGDSNLPPDYYKSDDKLQWHLDYIEDLIEEGGGGGGSLKTINGQDLHGEGNISITTYQAFPETWPTDASHTTKQFCDAVNEDTSAVIGMGYFGGARWSDKPQGLSNFDIVVEILEGPNGTKSIHLIGTSSSVYPYRWEYTYWSNGSVSGWRGVQPELVSGTNIKTINNESILGEGNIEIQSDSTYTILLQNSLISQGTLSEEEFSHVQNNTAIFKKTNQNYEYEIYIYTWEDASYYYYNCPDRLYLTTTSSKIDGIGFTQINVNKTNKNWKWTMGQKLPFQPWLRANTSNTPIATLKDIKIGSDTYEITEVVANPTMAGGETSLTGIQIGSTKYAISGGSSEYIISLNNSQGIFSTEDFAHIKDHSALISYNNGQYTFRYSREDSTYYWYVSTQLSLTTSNNKKDGLGPLAYRITKGDSNRNYIMQTLKDLPFANFLEANTSKTPVGNLNSILIGSDAYSIPQVVANPTMTGSETSLTSIQIGDTKYAISGGGSSSKLYKHEIHWVNSPENYFLFYSTSNTEITIGSDLIQKLKGGELIYCGIYAYVYGYYVTSICFDNNPTQLRLYYQSSSGSFSNISTLSNDAVLTDTVTEA